jgi:integrase
VAAGSRRGHGESGIFWLEARQRWAYEIDLGIVDGKRRRDRKSFKTRKEAARALAVAKRALEEGQPTLDGRATLSSHLDHWMADVIEPSDRAASTKSGYDNAVRNHLKPGLGHHRLLDLRHEHVLTFMKGMRGKGASKSTMHTVLVVLRMALKQAVVEERLSRNVARDVEVPAPLRPAGPTRRLTYGERNALLAVLREDRLGPLFFLMYVLGLRRGEALGLRLVDLDFEDNVVHIRQQITRVTGKGLVIGPPKRQKHRSLSMGPVTVASLKAHLIARADEARVLGEGGWHESGLVFTTAEGNALDPSNVTHLMARLCKKAKIEHATPHSLRRTFADHAHDQGVRDKDLQQGMGHSHIGMTMDTYKETKAQTNAAFAALVERMLPDLDGHLADSLADTRVEND